jgi:hypothetical protein
MLIPLLALVIGLQSTQELESRLRQKEQEVERLTADLGAERRQVEALTGVVEKQRAELRRPFCSAELGFVSGGDPATVPVDGTVPLFLHGTVSRGCGDAVLSVSAAFLDGTGSPVCSGVVGDVAMQSGFEQDLNLLVRPWSLAEFVRWRNAPPQVPAGFKRLSCLDPDGLVEVNNTDAFARARSVRVRMTLLPSDGGIASVETLFRWPQKGGDR